jgi:UDP-N-acetyl-D-glucosamine dehydrogenase
MADNEVGIVGLGYVGLPLAVTLASAGYDVIGVDTDEARVRAINDGNSYVEDVSDAKLQEYVPGKIHATTDYEALSDVDGVSICVPTPLDKTQRPNLSFVAAATESLAEVIPADCTVILESTVYPRATEEVVASILESNGFTVGEDVFVAFSPERIDPGNEEYTVADIPKVVGGVTEECGIRAQALYEPAFEQIVPVESATEAELVKLLENTFRTVNIALINELATVAHELDVNIWDTIDAAATKPFGFMPFYPGPGLGGHCLPIDPLYLSWKAGEHGLDIEFIDLADRINRRMPRHVVDRTRDLLNDRGVPLSEASVFIVGLSYKADVADVRESPAFDVIDLLTDRGSEVSVYDPVADSITVEETEYTSVTDPESAAANADLTIVLTDHESVDLPAIVSAAPSVFDTRNAVGDGHEHVYTL